MKKNTEQCITSFDDAFTQEEAVNQDNNQDVATQKQTQSITDTSPLFDKAINSVTEQPAIRIQKNIFDEQSAPPIQKTSPDEQSAPPIPNNILDEQSAPPIQKASPDEQSGPPTKKSNSDKKNYINKKSFVSSSKKILIPGTLLAAATFSTAYFLPMDTLVDLMFDPKVMETQPDFLKNNISTVLNVGLYLIGGLALYLSIKAKSQGRLYIYDNYLLHKSMFNKTKILIPEIVATDIHWTPFSLLKDVGNLEVSSRKKDILFKNCSNPDRVKELIQEKCRNFKEL
jgi:hypothetical protein